jgi:hypothetical protein
MRFLLATLMVLVILPTTIVSVVLTGLYFAALFGQGQMSPTFFLIVIGGWVGIVTLWHLYFHFRRHTNPPTQRWRYYVGLIIGSAASLSLSWVVLSPAYPGVAIFFAWPLIAAIAMGLLLSASSDTPSGPAGA